MSQAPALSRATVDQYARRLVEKSASTKVLALRADPTAWEGPQQLDVEGNPVAVRACPSSLAVREALLDRDGFMILLTDRDAADLGDSLTARFLHQRIETVDPWGTVYGLFAATSVASDLKAFGLDVAQALAEHRPSGGYPVAPTGVVTADLAMGALLASVLEVDSDRLDPTGLLDVSLDINANIRWLELPQAVRDAVVGWARDGLGLVAPVILRILASPTKIDAVTIGLACDVLYRPGAPDAAVKAQGRLETYLDGYTLPAAEARALADSSLAYLRGLPTGDQTRTSLLARGEQFLADLHWAQGAQLSPVLPSGYAARLHALGSALAAAAGADDQVEKALKALTEHDLANDDQATATQRASMAVRLHRWLCITEQAPDSLREALTRQTDVDAWVDRAIADVFAGSSDPHVADSYRRIAAAAMSRRTIHDEQFAAILANAIGQDRTSEEAIGVEDVLARLVVPLTADVPLLIILVDGMSTAVAAELAEGATRRGWVELISGAGRQPVLAALPTLTRYSRTSLFTGTLRDGTQTDEKTAFATRLGGAPLFHKDDLRSAAGEELPATVRAAIGSDTRIVGVVLNTVDDALAKADPGGIDWTLDTVQHLGPLLDLAARRGRTVVLTSDHGHVIERGSEHVTAAGSEARFRPDDGQLQPGEVLLAGPRVLANEGRVIAATHENRRYGNKAAGYHGGASAAEVTIPFLVFTRSPDPLASTGWTPAPPLAPEWWLEPAATTQTRRTPTTATTPAKKAAPSAPGQDALFSDDELVTPTDSGPSKARALADGVLASPTFQAKRQRTARVTIDDATLAEVLVCLAERGGRAHRDVVAQAAGIPSSRMTGAIPAIQRLLNVEGYQVLNVDPDGVTIVLDAALLREQFGLTR